MVYPNCVLIFSGKRKSGKDYITDHLKERLGPEKAVIIRTSVPIKAHFAKIHNVDLERLMGPSDFKEKFRLNMIKWGEEIREKDYGYFCRNAIEMFQALNYPIWIISDARRRTDIQWFHENYGEAVKTVRIVADKEVRIQRGWVFTEGVDNGPSECDLDGVTDWDFITTNNGNSSEVEEILVTLCQVAKSAMGEQKDE